MWNNKRDKDFPIKSCPEFGTLYKREDNIFVPIAPLHSKEFIKFGIESTEFWQKLNRFNIHLRSQIEFIPEKHKQIIKIEIDLDNVKYIAVKQRGSTYCFYFSLKYPPLVFKKLGQKSSKFYHSQSYLTKVRRNTWKYLDDSRSINSMHNYDATEPVEDEVPLKDVDRNKDYILADSYLSTESEFLNFYLLNLVLKFELEFESEIEYKKQMIKFGWSDLINMSKIKPLDIRSCNDEEEEKIWKYVQTTNIQFYKYFLLLNYILQYSLLSLICYRKENIFNFPIKLLKYLSKLSPTQQHLAAIIVDKITTDEYEDDLTIRFKTEFKQYLDTQEGFHKYDIRHLTRKVRKVSISTDMVYYNLPIVERDNHMVRKLDNHRLNLIKVTTSGPCFKKKMHFNDYKFWVFANLIERAMLLGVTIGSKIFKLAISSQSQMKEGSYWFFCNDETEYISCHDLIKSFGDFSKELNPFKIVARMGQICSTSRYVIELESDWLQKIPDIEREGKVFTDGIGKISPDLAKKCCEAYGVKKSSAFQIRLGGIKGVVAIDENLNGYVLQYRPSMKKFDSKDHTLNIILSAQYSQGYLNRQILLLLKSLGLDDDIPKILQDSHLEMCKRNLKNLQTNKMKDFENIGSFYSFGKIVDQFEEKNLLLTEEPFFYNLIHLSIVSQIIELKKKGKIYDPKSVSLLGVIDEHNILEENEVYVSLDSKHYSKWAHKTKQILDTDVIVAKNPCTWPGDIKLLKAISKKEGIEKLKELKNVVVFSAKGKIPMPCQISGGDLDGDRYFVSWNGLITEGLVVKNYPSLDEEMKEPELEVDVRAFDSNKLIAITYINIMKFDTLGHVTNLHAMVGDRKEDGGAAGEKCKAISKLFRRAVDAAKYGTFVHSDEIEKIEPKPKEYPDFLEIDGFASNISEGLLGQLYRAINYTPYLEVFLKINHEQRCLTNFKFNLGFLTKDCYKYIYDVVSICDVYSRELKRILKLNNLFCELELFCFQSIPDKTRRSKIDFEFCSEEIHVLKTMINERIMVAFGKMDRDIAAALYAVTYLTETSLNDALKKFSMPLSESLSDIFNENPAYLSSECRYKAGNNNTGKNICEGRILSLPWMFETIRENLFDNYLNFKQSRGFDF